MSQLVANFMIFVLVSFFVIMTVGMLTIEGYL